MNKVRGATVRVTCENKLCKINFEARVADRKRGWGKFCSKSCKAKRQERQTLQYASYLHNEKHGPDSDDPMFNDAHLFSNEEHDCNKD